MRKKRTSKSYIGIIFCVLIVIIFFWWQRELSPADTANTTKQAFVVNKGESVRQIAADLKANHLIRSEIAFLLYIKQSGLSNKMQAGEFRISPSQSITQIAKTLITGMQDIWVTVPEGWRADEIADALKDKIPTYEEAWRQTLDNNEGFLFPDTYLIPHDATIDGVLSQMKGNFDKKYLALTNQYPPQFTQNKIVTIASMIEREAKTADDQRLISSVIYNRLNIGMALQIDATIQYALGNSDKWWPVLPDSGSNVLPNSTYNTYTHPGLPPTPISNPGAGALTAALNPAKSNYLYYITDKHGVNHYARTVEEHEANIKKYGL